MFRKPKKHIQRRVFSSHEDDEVAEHKMTVAEEDRTNAQSNLSKVKRNDKKDRSQSKQTLLSFGDEGKCIACSCLVQASRHLQVCHVTDEGEAFQVKKSSHSKKIMKLLDKERRKKKEERSESEEVKIKTEDKRTEIVTGDLVVCVNYLHSVFPM